MKQTLITAGVAALLCVALFFLGKYWLNAEYHKGYDAAIAYVENKQKDAKEIKQEKVDTSSKQDYENEKKLHTIIADSNATIVSLRNVIAQDSQRQSATIAQSEARTATYRVLFLTCSERYSGMATEADEVNLVAHGLQGYVKAIN